MFSSWFWFFFSILSCPIARKHRLEEEEQYPEKPPSKRKAPPLRLALDEGFSADSDTSSDGDGEKDEDEAGAALKGECGRDSADEDTQDRQTDLRAEEDVPEEDRETSLMEEEAPATEKGDICSVGQ